MRQIPSRRLGLLALLTALPLSAGACAHRTTIEAADDPAGVSVDVGTLWKKEAAEDPITAYRIRIAAEPGNAGLHNNLGNLYVLENRMDEALKEFRTAAKLERESPVPWNNIGTTYRKMGQSGAAAGAFRKALKIDDRYALAWYNLGTVYDDDGDYDQAIEHYLRALALNPKLAEARHNPQVVENRNLVAVKLRHFIEEAGNISLPLDRLPE